MSRRKYLAVNDRIGQNPCGLDILIVAFLFLATGCSTDKIVNTEDNTSPSAITDLIADTSTTSSVTLSWTSTGDDGKVGTAFEYDIRYSTSHIDSSNWDAATQCTGEPSPEVAGSSQSFVVTGLDENQDYYFVIKARDEAGNESDISNISHRKTTIGDYVTWARIYDTDGMDWPADVIVTDDGCYLAAGFSSTYGDGYGDGYLVKLDPNGNIIWQRTYGTWRGDEFRSICKYSGGYVMAGESGWSDEYPGAYGAFFVGVNTSGDELWRLTWYGLGNARAWEIIQANDGGSLALGDTYTGMSNDHPFEAYSFLLKLDDDDTITDSIILSDSLKKGLSDFSARSITVVSDGYIIAGTIQWHASIVKISSDFKQIVINYIDMYALIWAIESIPQGGAIVSGQSPAGSDKTDLLLIRLDDSGSEVWTNTYSYSDLVVRDEGLCISPAPDGGFVAAGITYNGDWADIFVIKVNSDGIEQWKRRYGQLTSADLALSVATAPDGGYIIAGDTWEGGWSPADLYMIKTDPWGGL